MSTSLPPRVLADADACAREIVDRLDGRIMLGLPLGLGKPAHVVNALYALAKADSNIELDIFTALTLDPPRGGSFLAERFAARLRETHYNNYERIAFEADRRRGGLPGNVRIAEFYLAPGALLSVDDAQQRYTSSNYTHVVRDLMARGVNVIAQLVATRGAPGERRYSLGSNPDLTLDVADAARAAGRKLLMIGQVSRQMPFMPNDAEVPENFFNIVLDGDALQYPLFPVPARPVELDACAAGLNAASLVEDGGTLQIGIGSMGDAVAHALILRHERPEQYAEVVAELETDAAPRGGLPLSTGRFEDGLFGSSEVFAQGFAELRKAGILKREVERGGRRLWMESAFFLGPEPFYEWLRTLPDEELSGIDMTRVSRVNQLYGDEAARRSERRHARFVNEAMMVTLSGAVVSDALEDGRVVSGIGGQYNFVAMAHALDDARAVIILPATRRSGGEVKSNIVFNYGHASIPRHLRDVVVTEYGVADLRGRSDRDVAVALIGIADSRFQEGLLEEAKQAGKIESGYGIPAAQSNNLPERLDSVLSGSERAALFPVFVFGTEMDDAEARLAVALTWLKQSVGGTRDALGVVLKGERPSADPEDAFAALGLDEVGGLRGWFYRRLVAAALAKTESPRPLRGRPKAP